MKKKVLSAICAALLLIGSAVNVFAYEQSEEFGPSGKESTATMTWSAGSVTAKNSKNSNATYNYCKAYINYDNGDYVSKYNSSTTTAITAKATHSSYPSGATKIDSYSTYHKITVGGTNYTTTSSD